MHREFSSAGAAPYRPPAPVPKQMLSLFDGELLSMLPLSSYEQKVLSIRRGKRPVILVNDPELIRVILGEKAELFVKSDVAVGALEPVVGSGLLISTGELWRRQRSMLDPALGRLRVRAMFPHMRARLDGFLRRLKPGEELSLESEIGILVFEIMCRSIFSTSLGASAALEMIEDLAGFQKLLPQLGPLTLFGFTDADDKTEEIRRRGKILRARIGALIDERLMGGAHNARDDILQAVIDARSSENAEFTREELIDHIMVFVFAGYDTTASALTWAFFILSQQSELVKELRQEVNGVAAGRDLVYEDIASLSLARMVFLETLRLYPPVAFLSRTALQKTLLGETVVEQGSLLVISPWVLHRHRLFWKSPEIFVPRRFSGDAERDINSGSFIPFGFGQRICPGRMVALTEGPFLISSILRHFDVEVANPAAVMPVSRITIRPNTQIDCRFRAVN